MEIIKFLKQLTWTVVVVYIDCFIFILFITLALIDLMRLCSFYSESIFSVMSFALFLALRLALCALLCSLNDGSADSVLQLSNNNIGFRGSVFLL